MGLCGLCVLCGQSSEIPLAFAVFHGGFGAFVVSAGAALGLASGGDFCDDLVEIRGGGFHCAGAGDVADRAESDSFFLDLLGLVTAGRFDEAFVKLRGIVADAERP